MLAFLKRLFGKSGMQPGYLEQIRHEIGYIKPHVNRDLRWREEGLTLLREGELQAAELKFKELVMSQPEHHDGYEGLALTYQRLGRKDEALFFIQEAIIRARRFLDEGTLDQVVLDEIEQEFREIQQMEEA
jgi:tetratricopeptide (TPR) repeat protein